MDFVRNRYYRGDIQRLREKSLFLDMDSRRLRVDILLPQVEILRASATVGYFPADLHCGIGAVAAQGY